MVRFPSPLGPDETPERAAYWIAQAAHSARRSLFEAYVELFTEADPAFESVHADFARAIRVTVRP